MHDFISYLFSLLQRSLVFAVPMLLVCAVALVLASRQLQRRGRAFPRGKAATLMLLILWAAVTLYATVLRGEPTVRQWNLTPLLAWREAYQRFTLQIWLNVLLNVALFIPLGILLPLLHRAFRRWYAALAAGFALSLGIELAQLLTMRGMFDVDDLLNNTLGALLGWCAAELVLRLRARNAAWKRCCLPPLAFVLLLGCIFGCYACKPYGNLREASVEKADLRAVTWQTECTLGAAQTTAMVYQTERYSRTDAEAFAEGFSERLGISFPDAYYYDDLIIFANHTTGDFLHVTLHDGTWDYTVGDEVAPTLATGEVSAAALRAVLEGWGIEVAADAVYDFTTGSGGFSRASFTFNLLPMGDSLLSGTLECILQARTDGALTIYSVSNTVAALTPVREERIISPVEALERLQGGRSFEGTALAYSGAETITVRACALDYLSDSKGFYQPVYRFTLALGAAGEEVTDYVPAL